MKLMVEFPVAAGLCILGLKLLQRGHKSFGNIASAVSAKASWSWFHRYSPGGCHGSAFRTAATNAFNFSGSLRPGLRSTPVTTSTPHGWNIVTASPTFSGFNPPAIMKRPFHAVMPLFATTVSASLDQSNVLPLPAPESNRMQSTHSELWATAVKRAANLSSIRTVLIMPMRGLRDHFENSPVI